MTTPSHICLARREQAMVCKVPLVFTALALARIIKWGKKQVSNVETVCVPGYQHTHPQWLAILFWRKLLTKPASNALFISEAEHESQPYLAACAQHEWEKTLHENSSGVLFWGRLPVRWGWWWVCLLPYSHRRCLQVSCPGLTAGTSGRQQLICLITLNPEPSSLWGCCLACQGWARGPVCLQGGWQQGNYRQTDPVTSTHWEHWSCF